MVKITSNKTGKYLSEVYSSMQVKELLQCIEKEKSVFAVVDDRAFKDCPQVQELCGLLDLNGVALKRVKTSEALKSPETVLGICEWLIKKKADRTSLLIGIGGGILTDMAGFAACIYMRGIRYALVPTTLLAQVDAGVGGKTGVNFGGYKNMLGIIRQPEFSFICPGFLSSLARREFFSGAAELLKTFMINNENGAYGRAVLVLSCIAPAVGEEEFHQAVAGYGQELFRLVTEAVRVKMEIVSIDPFERGERRKLNLGHTFAHAIEHCAAERLALLEEAKQASKTARGRKSTIKPEDKMTRADDVDLLAPTEAVDITHGEAVAMGLVLAAGMSEKQGVAREGFRDQIESDLQTCGLGTECPFEKIELMRAMQHDKKSAGAEVNFVMMREVGDVIVVPVRLKK